LFELHVIVGFFFVLGLGLQFAVVASRRRRGLGGPLERRCAPTLLPSLFPRTDGSDVDLTLVLNHGEVDMTFYMNGRLVPDVDDMRRASTEYEAFCKSFLAHLVGTTIDKHPQRLRQTDTLSVLLALSRRQVPSPQFPLSLDENGRHSYLFTVDARNYRFELIVGVPAWTFTLFP
jgi:hypothetical protein